MLKSLSDTPKTQLDANSQFAGVSVSVEAGAEGLDGTMLRAKVRRHNEPKNEKKSRGSPRSIFTNGSSRGEESLNVEAKKNIQMMERLQKLMKIPAQMIEESKEAFMALKTLAEHKLSLGLQGCRKLLSNLKEFDKNVETTKIQLKSACENNYFKRANVIKTKFDSLDDGLNEKRGGLARVRKIAAKKVYSTEIENLSKAKWFLKFMSTLK